MFASTGLRSLAFTLTALRSLALTLTALRSLALTLTALGYVSSLALPSSHDLEVAIA